MNNYDDIINMPHHVSKTRKPMSLQNRSAQFAPFSALTTYDEAIREVARETSKKIELDDGIKLMLNDKLSFIKTNIKLRPKVTITYFVKDKKKLALDLCEVRLMIEPELAALAAVRATPEEVEKLQEIENQVEQLCSRQMQHMEKDIEFHEMIAKMSKNSVMPKLVPVIQAGVSVFIEVTDLALVRETVRTHQMVVDAIRNRDSEKARAAMVEHLKSNKDKIEEIFVKNND